MLTATRLTYRINRFEIRVILIATALSVVVSAAVIGWIRSSGYLACIVSVDAPTIGCLQLQDVGAWVTRIATLSTQLVPFFPFLAGLLLGGPLIARELDKGTARLAWSLGPSRGRWYAQRVLPIVVVVVSTAMIIGVVGEQLIALFAPDVDLANSFVGFHLRGVLIASAALLVVSIAVAIGSIIGRPVPTLVLALALGGATLVAVTEVNQRMLAGEAVRLAEESGYPNDLVVGEGRFELPDGRLLTWNELTAEDPTIFERPFDYPFVTFGIPGQRYREVEAREALAHVALSLVFLGAGAVVVGRRRPG